MYTSNNTKRPTDEVPTVFLHGFSGDGTGLRPFADAYIGKDALCINMPGFGGATAPLEGGCDDIYKYADAVWGTIRGLVLDGPVNLVGHSHGAMVGYVLALQHPDEVKRLDLFCPIAYPRLIPRLTIRTMQLVCSIGISKRAVVRLMASPFMVSLVTRYSFNPLWTDDDKRRITEMRQREAKFYSPIMFDLMKQAMVFGRTMKDTHCEVPTQICHVSDENVAGNKDYLWYKQHANVVKLKEITGGHLCVVANPKRVVDLFMAKETV